MEDPPSNKPLRLEPTVFGAIRRYRAMVLAIAVVGMAAAVGYTLIQGKIYRAQASVTMPHQVSLQGQDPAQYLDSQVLLLRSPNVARRAASVANATLHSNFLSDRNFYGPTSSLKITPPTGASAGVYGASIIDLSFTWPSPRVAQGAANAVLQGLDDVRSATITTQADAVVAGIDQALRATSDQGQRQTLQSQRTQALLNEQIDLAHHPTAAFAAEPTAAANGGWKRTAAIGLIIGIILGAALAYARASLRRSFAGRREPEAVYGAPLLGEIPVFAATKTSRRERNHPAALLPADPHSAAAEAFRFAARSVEHVGAAQGARPVLAFVSPLADAGKSTVVANLALAIAEGSIRVLVVDADAAEDDVTARLLPRVPAADGFEQVLAGQRALADCVLPSPFNSVVAVLGSGPATPSRVRGAARSKAAEMLFAEARACYDVVLIDTPALEQEADATGLVGASDAAVVVVNPNELVRVHLEVADRLTRAGADVAGYIYNRAPRGPRRPRNRHTGASARPVSRPPARRPAPADTRPLAPVSYRPSAPPAET